MGEGSAVRAAVSKSAVATIATLPAEQASSVRRRIPPDVLSRIESALGVAWIPTVDHLHLFEATRVVLTDAELRVFWRRSSLLAFEQPLMKSAWDSAQRLFGVTPSTFLKWSPRVWEMITRDLGQLAWTEVPSASGGAAHLAWSNVPKEYTRSGSLFDGMAGSFEAFLELSRSVGAVTVVQSEPAAGRVVYELRWR